MVLNLARLAREVTTLNDSRCEAGNATREGPARRGNQQSVPRREFRGRKAKVGNFFFGKSRVIWSSYQRA